MKSNYQKLALGLAFAVSTLLVSPLSFADQAVEDKKLYDLIKGINGEDNLTNKQLANALINYEAAARMNEYSYNQQLLFMAAPGAVFAVGAGNAIGGAVSIASQTANTMSNTGLLNSISRFSFNKEITMPGSTTPINTTNLGMSPNAVWKAIGNPFMTGNGAAITPLNPSLFLQANNLSKSNLTNAQAQTMVNFISNPNPYSDVDPSILAKLENMGGGGLEVFLSKLTPADKEAIASSLEGSAKYGLSAGALSDILARRTPPGNEQKSMMEVMDESSKQRFTSQDWYKEIGAASNTALLREITHILAYDSWVRYQQFRVEEQQMALLASLNSAMANMNILLQKFGAQLQAAQAEAQAAAQQMQKQVEEQQGATGTQGQ